MNNKNEAEFQLWNTLGVNGLNFFIQSNKSDIFTNNLVVMQKFLHKPEQQIQIQLPLTNFSKDLSELWYMGADLNDKIDKL